MHFLPLPQGKGSQLAAEQCRSESGVKHGVKSEKTTRSSFRGPGRGQGSVGKAGRKTKIRQEMAEDIFKS